MFDFFFWIFDCSFYCFDFHKFPDLSFSKIVYGSPKNSWTNFLPAIISIIIMINLHFYF